jgi:hypothetical protein
MKTLDLGDGPGNQDALGWVARSHRPQYVDRRYIPLPCHDLDRPPPHLGIFIAEDLANIGQNTRAAFDQHPFRTVRHLNVI